MKIYNTSRDFKAGSAPKRKVRTKKSFDPNLSTNYELMLRIYLAEKQNKLAKERYNTPRFTKARRAKRVKSFSSSIWYSLTQVVQRANNFITTWSSPKVEMLTK